MLAARARMTPACRAGADDTGLPRGAVAVGVLCGVAAAEQAATHRRNGTEPPRGATQGAAAVPLSAEEARRHG